MRSPTTTSPIAMARSSSLRRPRASQIASAATASATSHIQSATARSTFVAVCAVSSWLSSMIAILPDGLRQPLGDLSDHRDLVAELDHDRAEVEHDRATLGLDERRVVVQEAHQLALGPRRHLHPHRLHPWPFEHGIRRPIGARAGETGENGREPLLRGRQALRDRRLDVDVPEQRLDRLRRDLGPDLVVLDHVPRDRLEAVLVEGGVLDVERDHPDEREEDRDDRENTGDDDAPTRCPGGLRGLSWLAHQVEYM